MDVILVDFYRPQRSWAKVMFLQASVILSRGGGWSGPRGVSNFSGGLQFFGGSPIFRVGVSNFSEGGLRYG